MSRFLNVIISVLLLSACTVEPNAADQNTAELLARPVGYFGLGQPATPGEIAGWDIDVRPDGQGLPDGSGSVEDGEILYEAQCAECHGSFGEGVGRYPVLAGGAGSLQDSRPSKTVGSFWPYTSTLYDYIRRAMPFAQPESLSADETYALTAYVLYLNDLVDDDFVLSQANLATVRLPNETNFVVDQRPDVANTRCMNNCRDAGAIEILSEVSLEMDVAAQTLQAAATAAHPGQNTYDQFCSICHKIGVSGAPVLGDAEAWVPRISAGIESVFANAINGVTSPRGVMPPKGGFVQLSDDEVTSAVEYMLEQVR